jgi:hypothetical protein
VFSPERGKTLDFKEIEQNWSRPPDQAWRGGGEWGVKVHKNFPSSAIKVLEETLKLLEEAHFR